MERNRSDNWLELLSGRQRARITPEMPENRAESNAGSIAFGFLSSKD